MKLLTIDQNVGNWFTLLMRGFNVAMNSACTQVLVGLGDVTVPEAVKILAEALGVAKDDLEVMQWPADGMFLVQPAVPMVVSE